MKKYMFVVAATLGMMIGTGASAQQPRGRKAAERPTAEQLARQKTDRMKAKLALTDQQAEQIYAYNLQQVQEQAAKREQMRAAMEARRAEMEAKRKAQFEAMRAARKAEADKMQSILTPEQFEKWQQAQRRPMYAKHKMAKRGKGPRRDGMHRGDKFGRSGKRDFRGQRGPGAKRGGKREVCPVEAGEQAGPEKK